MIVLSEDELKKLMGDIIDSKFKELGFITQRESLGDDVVFTFEEVASILKCSLATVYKSYKKWGLPYKKIGGRVIFPREGLERFINDEI